MHFSEIILARDRKFTIYSTVANSKKTVGMHSILCLKLKAGRHQSHANNCQIQHSLMFKIFLQLESE